MSDDPELDRNIRWMVAAAVVLFAVVLVAWIVSSRGPESAGTEDELRCIARGGTVAECADR